MTITLSNGRKPWWTQNMAKAGPNSNNKFGYRGVAYYKRTGRYIAQISLHGKRLNLGYFDTAEQAHTAVTAKQQEIWNDR